MIELTANTFLYGDLVSINGEYIGFIDRVEGSQLWFTYAWCIRPGSTYEDDIKNGSIDLNSVSFWELHFRRDR